jgi:hypothetical protein
MTSKVIRNLTVYDIIDNLDVGQLIFDVVQKIHKIFYSA